MHVIRKRFYIAAKQKLKYYFGFSSLCPYFPSPLRPCTLLFQCPYVCALLFSYVEFERICKLSLPKDFKIFCLYLLLSVANVRRQLLDDPHFPYLEFEEICKFLRLDPLQTAKCHPICVEITIFSEKSQKPPRPLSVLRRLHILPLGSSTHPPSFENF